MNPKVLLVTNMLSPYRVPLFSALGELIQTDMSGELQVAACTSADSNRDWVLDLQKQQAGFIFEVLPGYVINRGERFIYINHTLPFKLIKERPSVVISSGFSLASLFSLVYARLFGARFILWNGGTLLTGNVSPLRVLLRKFLSRSADACVAYGSAAREYLIHLGAEPGRVFLAYNTIDSTSLTSQVSSLKPTRLQFKESQGFPEIILLYVGSFIKRKGIDNLLRAYARVVGMTSKEVGLVLVGSGPEEARLKVLCDQLGLNKVLFAGFVQPQQVGQYLAAADISVFPTLEDVWGLVINEAMTCGLPVVASKYAEAVRDLIVSGQNGFVVDPCNTEEMAQAILRLVNDDDLRKEIGAEAQFTMQRFRIADSASGFLKAITYVLDSDK